MAKTCTEPAGGNSSDSAYSGSSLRHGNQKNSKQIMKKQELAVDWPE
jgi:hypothetical protein